MRQIPFRSRDLPSLPPCPRDVNQKLVDQYTEIARLAGGLAHEIKNPLSTIRLNMELLAEDFRDSDSPRDRRAMREDRAGRSGSASGCRTCWTISSTSPRSAG